MLDGVRHRLYVLLRGEAYADETRRELAFHRELDEVAAAGSSLGNETYYREEVRRMTPQIALDRIRQDLSYAARGLRRSPGFTFAVVVILGLGVGVNAAMFSVLDRVFVRAPAGVDRPAQIRRLYYAVRSRNMNGADERIAVANAPYPWFHAEDDAADPGVGLAAFTWPDSILIRDGNRRTPARQSLITARYFSTLGVRAERGRFFAPSEYDVATPTPLLVLSDAFWARAYQRDPSVIGRTVKIGSTMYTVIGVAQPGFTGVDLDAVDAWSPVNTYAYGAPAGPTPWYATYYSSFRVIARVRDDAAESRLTAAAQAAVRGVRLEHFVYDSTLRVVAGPVVEALGPMKRRDELVVATRVEGVAVIVLLIVVANVLNLLLLRAQRRQREIAVRRALGVSRGRLIQQMTVESICLSALGGAAAVLLSVWAGAALRRLFFPDEHWVSAAIDARTVWFILLVSLGIGIVGGLAPAAGIFRDDLANALKAGMKDGSYRGSRTRNALLALQASLCVVLLTGAGLFTRSLDAVRSIGTGYRGDTQFFASPTFDEPANHSAEVASAVPQIIDRLRAHDGVEAVGASSIAPLYGFSFVDVFVQGRDSTYKLSGDHFPTTMSITPGFLSASGLPLLSGRDFAGTDSKDAPRVAIVSDAMAKDIWPGESPLGKCLFLSEQTAPCSTVVGIVANAHRMRLIERAGSQFFTPAAQAASFPARTIVVRARPGRVNAVRRETEAVFRATLPAMSGLRIRTFESLTERELRPWRLGSTLFSWLGILALIVAAIGVYAVIAYGVSRRTQEMGIRLALGARARDIVELVLREGLAVVVIGITAGIVVALLLGRTIASLLFGVVPSDPSVIIGAAVVLCVVGSVASLIPGVRAARIDPMSALRAE